MLSSSLSYFVAIIVVVVIFIFVTLIVIIIIISIIVIIHIYHYCYYYYYYYYYYIFIITFFIFGVEGGMGEFGGWSSWGWGTIKGIRPTGAQGTETPWPWSGALDLTAFGIKDMEANYYQETFFIFYFIFLGRRSRDCVSQECHEQN